MMNRTTSSITENSHLTGFDDYQSSQAVILEKREMKVETEGDTSVQKQFWHQLGACIWIKIVMIGVLFVFLFRNEIENIVHIWNSDSSWSHGFLIPLFSMYFINQHKKEIINLQVKPNYFGLILMIAAILFYPFNIVQLQYGYLRPLTMIATLGAIVLFLGGRRLLGYLWFPIAFLIFAVPLPQRYYVSLTMPMRYLAAEVAAVLLNLVSCLEASVNGVIIEIIYKGQQLEPALNVAEACSGMRLLMAFLALGVAMAYLHYRPLWQRIILLISTIPIALFCNIIRVTCTGFIYVLIHPKYTQGIYHDMLGFAMLPLAFFLYGSLAWFMSSLFIDEEKEVAGDIVIRRERTK